MPEQLSLTGWKRHIRAYCDEAGIPKTDSQVSRMAVKVSKRMQTMNTVTDFYDMLRILGISQDPTAREAIKNMENAA